MESFRYYSMFFSWTPYLKTDGTSLFILFSITDLKEGSIEEVHQKIDEIFYIIILYKFQKRDVRIWALVSEYLQETHRSERELQDALQFQFLCRIVCSTILWYCPFIQSQKSLL